MSGAARLPESGKHSSERAACLINLLVYGWCFVGPLALSLVFGPWIGVAAAALTLCGYIWAYSRWGQWGNGCLGHNLPIMVFLVNLNAALWGLAWIVRIVRSWIRP